MSIESHISLIDLTKQLPFDIDNELKKEICFAETLVVSCGHYDGVIEEEQSDSEWSCNETTVSEVSEDVKDDKIIEIKDHVEEVEPEDDHEDDDNDFHFYFFPDCNKPVLPTDSKASLMIVDGLPKINPAAKDPQFCTCGGKGDKCICFTKLPCKCSAKTKVECTCGAADGICLCHEGKPSVVCTCRGSKVCLCYPDGMPRPVCTCNKIEKPCICQPGKFPSPECTCKHKPKYKFDEDTTLSVEYEIETNEEEESLEEDKEEEEQEDKEMKASDDIINVIKEEEPCDCQQLDPKPLCFCTKGRECLCKEETCICGIQKSCVCEPDEDDKEPVICKNESNKSICSCPNPRECTCDGKSTDCTCFPKKPECTCGDPEKCKCLTTCDCTNPCICDTLPEKEDECICRDKSKQVEMGLLCTCPCKDEGKKLKRMRAGKHGYRWCHDVDPRHTYFDFGYDRHDKIDYKEQEKEKFKILGLYDDKPEEVCAVHGIKVPAYKKNVKRPSLDCCSAVGGISISVETLGEDKDKFLVQVVSHSSKEGAKTGSKLVSILDVNLHTLEENRVEHITKRDTTKERRSYMAICDSGYYNKVTRICGERSVVKRFYHSFQDAQNFLLEGANVVLLRYFGLRRYKGTIKTETVLMDGTICESIYVCPGVSQAIVNGKPLFVVKVERHIIEPSGSIHQTLTVLTLRGYIVSHEWADNNYILHLNPLLRVDPQKDEIEQHVPLREKWREDLQLLSDYLDFKSTRSSEGARYMAENGELTATVRDYLQALLLLRPQDAVHFTRHYFGSAISALDLPHDEYFDSCPKHVRYFYFED